VQRSSTTSWIACDSFPAVRDVDAMIRVGAGAEERPEPPPFT
jgi:hypothetical protein